MIRRNRYARRVAVAASIAVAAGFLAQPGPSGADVTAVSGSAFGASGSISLLGGAPTQFGPIPTVTLPSTGGNESATAPSMRFESGGVFLTSGRADVTSVGATGPSGSATSTATVQNLNALGTTATTLSSTCTASEAGGLTGSTTVTGGRVPTGDTDREVEGDETYTDVNGQLLAPVTYAGFVPNVARDYYRVVFNEQIVTSNSITVNAAHFYLGENPPAQNGPFAIGEIIVGQSHCDIVPAGGTTPTTLGTTPTTLGTTPTTVGTTPTTLGTTPTTLGTTPTTLGTTATTVGTGGITTTTLLGGVTPPLFGSINVSDLIRQIVCPILQQLLADPFLGPIIRPFIEPFLVAFGCTA